MEKRKSSTLETGRGGKNFSNRHMALSLSSSINCFQHGSAKKGRGEVQKGTSMAVRGKKSNEGISREGPKPAAFRSLLFLLLNRKWPLLRRLALAPDPPTHRPLPLFLIGK